MQINKISGILTLVFAITFPAYCFWHKQEKEYTIILDPSGDAKRTGRTIGDSFERGLTLQCAEKIKSMLEEKHPHITVVITRIPGDIVYDLQNASLSNRINADLFISLNFYATTDAKPTLYVYQFSYGNDFAINNSDLTFLPYDQAYKINKTTTDAITQLCCAQLNNSTYNSLFSLSGPHSLPIKPLLGITTPSIAFETGLKNKDLWYIFVEPLVNTISAIVETL